MDRKENTIFWIFSKNGIESKVYKAVIAKKDYTTNLFLKDFGIKKIESKNNRIRG
jgi:hypothetical protein